MQVFAGEKEFQSKLKRNKQTKQQHATDGHEQEKMKHWCRAVHVRTIKGRADKKMQEILVRRKEGSRTSK